MIRHHKKIILASAVLSLISTYWMGTQIARDTTQTTQLHRIQTEIGSLAHRMGGDVTTRHETDGKASLTLKIHPDLEEDLAKFAEAHAGPADIETGPMTPLADGYRRIFMDITIRSEWRESMSRRWLLNPPSLPFYLGMSAALTFLLYMVGTFITEVTTEALQDRRARAAGNHK